MNKIFRMSSAAAFTGVFMLVENVTVANVQAVNQLMDYFMPTPITGSLSSTCWGAAQVGHRDQSNGLEDKTLANWVYWDGGILKGPDSTYYMFA
ncbi:MAG TPA: hypothetical protein VMT55_02590, partial [Candidatus Sulfotelmatobacter sp.]|nr:hypothetical protein [Candidatus Sulfotelmatobacter sp.]